MMRLKKYEAPKVDSLRLLHSVNLLKEISFDVKGEFDDLKNQDDWYADEPTD